jgi:hypothetical protein
MVLPKIFSVEKGKVVLDDIIYRIPILAELVNIKGDKKAIELLSFIWFYFDGEGVYKEVDISDKFDIIASDLKLKSEELRRDKEFVKAFDFIEDKYTDSKDRLAMRIKQTVQNLGIWAATEIHDDSTQKLAIVKESSTLFMRLAGAEEELQKGRKKGKLQSVAYDQTRKLKQKLND